MNRRNFLKKSTVAGAFVATGIGACHSAPDEKTAAQNIAGKSTDVDPDFELNETTIDALQEKMKRGELTAKEITERYLRRIETIDKKGPAINSVIELNPDALAIAESLDKERQANKVRGPLHGIPVLIKDNINTGDKMMTTAGSLALEGNRSTKDAFIIEKLRAAGAVLLGKTNLSEWANFRSSRSSSGWSSRGGQTKNPVVLDRNPCGSSSGSGAAVAANLCAVAIGTETDGSIIAPSSFCGIVGIKPTVGLLSRAGIIPISATQDTAGPMARSIKDAAILLQALVGSDPSDAATKDADEKSKANYLAYLNENALEGKTIGIEKSFFEGNEAVVDLYKRAIEMLKAKGAVVKEVELLKQTRELSDAEFLVLQYEFKDGLNRYLAGTGGKIKSLADVIAFNRQNEARAMPHFKQDILELSEKKGDLSAKEYQDAIRATARSKAIIDELMRSQKLDAIVGTSIGPANCIDLINGDYGTGFYFCPPAAMAGYPHITVPMGAINELPVGLSFITSAYREAELIGLAYAFEQATKHRTSPKFLNTASV